MDRCVLMLEAIKDKVIDDVKSIIVRMITLLHMADIDRQALRLKYVPEVSLCSISFNELCNKICLSVYIHYVGYNLGSALLFTTSDLQEWLPLNYYKFDRQNKGQWLINLAGRWPLV